MSSVKSPKFEQIKRRLIADIEAGILAPGVRIESETELMRRHGVARMTVVRSLNEMVSEGYLVRMRGKGTFVRMPQKNGDKGTLAAFALVTPKVREGFYPSLIKTFGDAASRLNHQMLTCNTDNSIERQGNTILQLIDNRVAGVALIPTTCGTSPIHHVRQLQANKIPVVQLHRGISGVAAPMITMERDEAGRLAGRTLLAAGHRRIAFFATHASLNTDAYAVGLEEVLHEVGGELSPSLVHYGHRPGEGVTPEHEAGLEVALRQMLELPAGRRPTAIFSTFDPDAELIYLTLNKLGVRVPADMSLISVGAAWRHSEITRRLTSVTADEGYAARTAVELLERMCCERGRIGEQVRLTIPLHVYAGETVQPMSA